MKNPFEKFKHRNIAKVATAYAVVGWLMLQMTEIILPTFNAPQWIAQTIIFVVIMGFPIAILIAWASESRLGVYEEGASEAGSETSTDGNARNHIPKKLFYGVGSISIAVIGLFAFYVSTSLITISDRDFENNQISETPVSPLTNFKGIRTSVLIGETGNRPGVGTRTDLAISPDGKLLAYLMNKGAGSEVTLRDLRGYNNERVLGTISGPGGSGQLKFSPDGEWIIFQDQGLLKRVRIEGGAFQSITNVNEVRQWGSHAVIGQDIYYSQSFDFQIHKGAFTGESDVSTPVTKPEDGYFFGHPSPLPGDQALLVTVCEALTGWSSCDVGVLDLLTGEVKIIIQTAFDATYVESGHLLFIRDSALWTVAFDNQNHETRGTQIPAIQGLAGNSFNSGKFAYSVSKKGRLVYLAGQDVYQGGGRIDIAWVDKDGSREPLPLPEGTYGNISLSPDQTQLAMTSYNGVESDIWTWDFEQEIFSRLTFAGNAAIPIWSNDSAEVIYQRSTEPFGLWATSSDGTGQPVILTESEEPLYPETISKEGAVIFSRGPNSARKLYRLQSSGERIQTLIDIGPSQVRSSRISPDGNWLLYTSDESGNFETFIRPWPNYNEGKWQASRLGGGQPLWGGNSQLLYFWAPSGIQYSVEYEIRSDSRSGRPSFRFQEPKEIFSYSEPRGPQALPGWAYVPDEDKFLMIAQGGVDNSVSAEDLVLSEQTILSVVEEFGEELKALAPYEGP